MPQFSSSEAAIAHIKAERPRTPSFSIELGHAIDKAGCSLVLEEMINWNYYLSSYRRTDSGTHCEYRTQTHWFSHLDDAYDPIVQVIDRKLDVTDATITLLRDYLDEPKFVASPILHEDERKLLTHLANSLTKRLIETIRENPTKLWVMRQLQETLRRVKGADTEVREHYGDVIYRLMKILDIQSTNGLAAYY